MRAQHNADICTAIDAALAADDRPGLAFTRALVRALDQRHGREKVDQAAGFGAATMWRWRAGRAAIGADSILTILTRLERAPQ